MQLNPARGRKLDGLTIRMSQVDQVVYAAQPREGTETNAVCIASSSLPFCVYVSQPREGTETPLGSVFLLAVAKVVYAAQPREGTETMPPVPISAFAYLRGLCSSTPRGDGNVWCTHCG